MSRTLSLRLACLLLCAVSLWVPERSFTRAQTTNLVARKIDEFADIEASDLIARLDNLAIELQNEPHARCFLMVYRTRRDLPGLSNRYAHRMMDYLVSFRGISPERIVIVDGGIASCLSQELWIVPIGAAPPLRADAYLESLQPATYKFDEHYYSLTDDPVDNSYWAVAPDNLFTYLDAFANALRKDTKLIGCLIAYKSAGRDGPIVSANMLRTEKNFLTKKFGIEPSRIRTIDGGYRKWRTMELWIVPKGDPVPIITSYRIRQSRRRR